MAYVASFAISLGPIFWLLNAEIYPLSVRSKAAGIGTMANWTFNFIVSLTFLLLIEALGRSGAFWFYGAIGIAHPGLLLEAGARRPRASASRTSRPSSRRGWTRKRRQSASAPGYPARMRIDEIIAAQAADLLGRVLPAEDGGGDRGSSTRPPAS